MRDFMKALEWFEKHEGHAMQLRTNDGEGEILITALFDSCDDDNWKLQFNACDSQEFYGCLSVYDEDESEWSFEIRVPHYAVRETPEVNYDVRDMRVNDKGNFEIVCDAMVFVFIEK